MRKRSFITFGRHTPTRVPPGGKARCRARERTPNVAVAYTPSLGRNGLHQLCIVGEAWRATCRDGYHVLLAASRTSYGVGQCIAVAHDAHRKYSTFYLYQSCTQNGACIAYIGGQAEINLIIAYYASMSSLDSPENRYRYGECELRA